MAEWLTLEVFDEASAAWVWRDSNADVLTAAAVSAGALSWEWHEHPHGVALEVAFRSDAALERFRASTAVRAALDRAPDPLTGVLVYRGRGGGSGAAVRRGPRPRTGSGAIALPEPEDDPVPASEPVPLLLAPR